MTSDNQSFLDKFVLVHNLVGDMIHLLNHRVQFCAKLGDLWDFYDFEPRRLYNCMNGRCSLSEMLSFSMENEIKTLSDILETAKLVAIDHSLDTYIAEFSEIEI